MKNLFLGMVLLFSASLFAQQSASSKSGVLQFDSEIIDYGTIEQNADGVRTFKFKNVGGSPIVISDIKTSCGCTVPTKPNKPVLPGETAEIGVKYATSRLGVFAKTLTVMSNADQKMKVLKIKGQVLKPKTSIR